MAEAWAEQPELKQGLMVEAAVGSVSPESTALQAWVSHHAD